MTMNHLENAYHLAVDMLYLRYLLIVVTGIVCVLLFDLAAIGLLLLLQVIEDS